MNCRGDKTKIIELATPDVSLVGGCKEEDDSKLL